MSDRFSNIFSLTEDQAIEVLKTPHEELDNPSQRYIAVDHLSNYPTEKTTQALIDAVRNEDPHPDNRIVRRKAVESLGQLRAVSALPIIRQCLGESDRYTVENAVWAIGHIGTEDQALLEEVAQLLETPDQTHRVIIHTLSKLNYQPALARIRAFLDNDHEPTASAATSAVCQLTGDNSLMSRVVAFLESDDVTTRRSSIQDLIDARYYAAIPHISKTPVSMVFRMRGIRLLADAGRAAGDLTFAKVKPSIEDTLRDHPDTITMVHEYTPPPELDFLVRELYGTDFGRCYLATRTFLESHADETPAALFATYEAEAYNDYGAHYHVIKLFGWLKWAAAYDLLVEGLHNAMPQFQKSRSAAAIALGELGDTRAIEELKAELSSPLWQLRYAILMALEKLGATEAIAQCKDDSDWMVKEKANEILTST